jgi:hypothetical protein
VEIQEEWIFWAIVKRMPSILQFENEITYSTLQKLYGIIQMNEDHDRAYNEYETQKIENISRGKK